MRVALGADASGALTDALLTALRERAIDVTVFGVLDDGSTAWASIGRAVGDAVASGAVDYDAFLRTPVTHDPDERAEIAKLA